MRLQSGHDFAGSFSSLCSLLRMAGPLIPPYWLTLFLLLSCLKRRSDPSKELRSTTKLLTKNNDNKITSMNTHQPQHALNGGILQNGYQLKHYHYARGGFAHGFAQKAEWLRNMDHGDFDAQAQRAQQILNDPSYQWAMRQHKKQPQWKPMLGMPEEPDVTALIATGNKEFAVAMIERYLQQYAAWNERFDQGGRKAENALELVDRGYTEERVKRRRKREKRTACVVQ